MVSGVVIPMGKSLVFQKAEQYCGYALCFVCLALFSVLFFNSFTSSWVNRDLMSEAVYFERDSLAGNLFFFAVAAAGMILAARLFRKAAPRVDMNRLALAAAAVSVCVAVLWVLASKTAPQADQSQIVKQAERFNAGDFSGLQQSGYVGPCQQQLGIISVLRVFVLVSSFFELENWQAFQLFNALTTGLLVYAGFRVVALISGGQREAEFLYLLLALFCAPMYVYTAFVYGESSSTAFAMAAVWMCLECIRSPARRYVAGLYLFASAALLLRTNVMIVLIALAIVMAIKLLRGATRGRLLAALALLLAMLTPTTLMALLYHDKIPDNSKSMPAILYIAMGTNDESVNAGWYNGYNGSVYQNCGFDPKLASETAKRDLIAFAVRCRQDPAYAADFYYRKIFSQWNAPMYQCLVMNNLFVGEQPQLVQSIYEGRGNEYLTAYTNIYQLVAYGGVLAFLAAGLKKRLPLENYLPLVAVLGGFLFSVLWEAKARYIFPYYLLMLPCTAAGVAAAAALFRGRAGTDQTP